MTATKRSGLESAGRSAGSHLGDDEGEHEQRESFRGVDHLQHDDTDAYGAAQRAAEEGGRPERRVHARVQLHPPGKVRVVRGRKQPPAHACRPFRAMQGCGGAAAALVLGCPQPERPAAVCSFQPCLTMGCEQ